MRIVDFIANMLSYPEKINYIISLKVLFLN